MVWPECREDESGEKWPDSTCKPRILITRLSHIGDCIQTVPMLNALRKYFPNSSICWICEPAAASLLQHHPALDELIIIPRNWMASATRVWKLRRQLRAYQFDIAIDPQGLTKSSMLGWLAGAKMRIGFSPSDGRELSRWLNNHLIRRSAENVVDGYLELLQPLGVTPQTVRFDLPIPRQDKAWAREYIHQSGLQQGFFVVNAGASWPSRMWEPSRFGKVVKYVSRQWSLTGLVVWAGEAERRTAREIADASGGAAGLAPVTTLPQLAALLKQSRMYVGTDSGPLHLAVAMGTKCVSLHGTTRAAKSGPHGAGHATVQAYYQHGSSLHRRHATNMAMLAISAADVCRACDRVLQRQLKINSFVLA